jgi:nucleoside-diphosphate-sugar epimerase
LRQATVGGWSNRMRFDLLVNTMTKDALLNGKINVVGPSLWRPYIDIKDLVNVYEKCIISDINISGTFNVVTDNAQIITIAQMVQEQLKSNNISVNIEIQDKLDKRNYKVSGNKFTDVFNMKYKHTILDMVQSILDNKMDIELNDDRFYNIRKFREMNI